MFPWNMISVKLFINKSTNKLVYAEAGKDFVDFLFHVFSLPVGAAMKHFEPDTIAVGSLGNLYKSVEDFDFNLLRHKNFLLNPRAAAPAAAKVPLWQTKDLGAPPIKDGVYYTCSNPFSTNHGGRNHDHITRDVSDAEGYRCKICREVMSQRLHLEYVAPFCYDINNGYVGDKVLYMVTDDLVVKPLTSENVLTLLLSNPEVKDMTCLESRDVSLDANQGMALLRASLFSKTVLTDIFLTAFGSGDSDPKKHIVFGRSVDHQIHSST